jgi:hypothetical protein
MVTCHAICYLDQASGELRAIARCRRSASIPAAAALLVNPLRNERKEKGTGAGAGRGGPGLNACTRTENYGGIKRGRRRAIHPWEPGRYGDEGKYNANVHQYRR